MSQEPKSPPSDPTNAKAPQSVKRLTREERHTMGTAIMVKRLFGGPDATVQAIADALGIHRVTASRHLTQARRDGVPAAAREVFIRDMLPAAMTVVLEAMRSDDLKVALSAAKMVIEGLDAMGVTAGSASPTEPGVEGNDSLEVWRERIKVTRTGRPADPRDDARNIIDASAEPAGLAEGHEEAGGDGTEEVPL